MTCRCGKPAGHTGRHRVYQTPEAKAAARRVVKRRANRAWRERQMARRRCQTCGAKAEAYSRCLFCRIEDARAKAARRARISRAGIGG